MLGYNEFIYQINIQEEVNSLDKEKVKVFISYIDDDYKERKEEYNILSTFINKDKLDSVHEILRDAFLQIKKL